MKKGLIFITLLITGGAIAYLLMSSKEECTSDSYEFNETVKLRSLMRTMLNKSDSLKERLVEAKPVGVFGLDQSAIVTAKSTNKRTKEPYFKGLAQTYFKALEDFNKSTTNKKKKFNSLIDGCVNCHESVVKAP